MKAIVFKSKKANPLFELKTIEQPQPKPNEILVKVHFASPNAADYRALQIGIVPKHRVYGSAVLGVVEAIGYNTTQFKKGDEVFADLTNSKFGGFAEYAVVPEHFVCAKPKAISFEHAAVLPVAASTALKTIRKTKLEKGHKVLILGTGGGVGSYTLQLANHLGAKVTAVCSERNAEQALEFGAEEVIDYNKTKIKSLPQKFDRIYAINGDYPLFDCLGLLKTGGDYAVIGGSLSQLFKALIFGKLLSLGSKKVYSISGNPTHEEQTYCANALAQEIFKPRIYKTYKLEETNEAMTSLMQGHANGKMVIKVS